MTTNENVSVNAGAESEKDFKRVYLSKEDLTDAERATRNELIDSLNRRMYPGLKPEQYAAMRSAMLGARVKPENGGDPIPVVGVYKNKHGFLSIVLRSENEVSRTVLEDGSRVFMSVYVGITKPRKAAEKRITKQQAIMALAAEYAELAIAGKRPALPVDAWIVKELPRLWQPAKKGEESAE